MQIEVQAKDNKKIQETTDRLRDIVFETENELKNEIQINGELKEKIKQLEKKECEQCEANRKLI